jgi:hypothetical protein
MIGEMRSYDEDIEMCDPIGKISEGTETDNHFLHLIH